MESTFGSRTGVIATNCQAIVLAYSLRVIFYRLCRVLPLRPLFYTWVLLFAIILPFLGWFRGLQYSTFFLPGNINYAEYLARNKADERVAKAESYFRHMTVQEALPYHYPQSAYKSDIKKFTSSSTVVPNQRSLSIVVMCHNRDADHIDAYEPHYLPQTLHALYHALDLDVAHYGPRWLNVSVRLCNVDPLPEKCHECKRMEQQIVGGTPKWNFAEDMGAETTKSPPQCRARVHTAYCLAKGAEQASKLQGETFVILLEDDMLAPGDAFAGLWSVLTGIQKRVTPKPISSELGYIQLHSPEHRLTYSIATMGTFAELLLLGVVVTCVLMLLFLRVFMRTYHPVYNWFLLTGAFLMSLCFIAAVGRPHWLHAFHAFTRAYSLSHIVTTQFSALLMPRERAMEAAQFLQKQTCDMSNGDPLSKGELLYSHLVEHQKDVFAVFPNIMRHVGLYSSFGKTKHYPYHLDD